VVSRCGPPVSVRVEPFALPPFVLAKSTPQPAERPGAPPAPRDRAGEGHQHALWRAGRRERDHFVTTKLGRGRRDRRRPKRKPLLPAAFRGGRYWARTSDPQLVELVTQPRRLATNGNERTQPCGFAAIHPWVNRMVASAVPRAFGPGMGHVRNSAPGRSPSPTMDEASRGACADRGGRAAFVHRGELADPGRGPAALSGQ